MADKSGRAVDEVRASHAVAGADVRRCTACGAHHGSVTAEVNCLRRAVVRLRGELAGARFVAESFARALAPGR